MYIVVVRGIYKGGDNEKWTVALSGGQCMAQGIRFHRIAIMLINYFT